MKSNLLKFQIKKKYRKLTSTIIRSIYQDNVRDLGKSILVAGSARSGTTWLADIIASQSKSRVMFEPFNPNLVPEYSKFNYFQYMRPEDYDQNLYEFCHKVFTGKIRNAWIDREIRVIHPQGRVIKCIRSTLMLKWLDVQFPEVPKIFIVRHPCAVVLSRMKLSWATDGDIGHFLSQPKLVSDFLENKMEVIAHAESDEEKHALIWCLTNLVPVHQFQSNQLNLVLYEKLVQNPEEEFSKIFNLIQVQYDPKMYPGLVQPSMTSTPSSAVIRGERRTDQWKNELSSNQVDAIYRTIERMGLDHLVSAIEDTGN
jgi:Sulfotransferase family